MTDSTLQDRAERAAVSLIARLSVDPLEEIDRALIFRALTLGWLHGYESGTADGIEYAASSLQAFLDGKAS